MAYRHVCTKLELLPATVFLILLLSLPYIKTYSYVIYASLLLTYVDRCIYKELMEQVSLSISNTLANKNLREKYQTFLNNW